MEKFVDRIIETDRKAREIIEQAQQEKQAVLADAKKRADAEIARRETEADKGDRKSTRLNSSHRCTSRMPSSA